jgi:hypothetical protein
MIVAVVRSRNGRIPGFVRFVPAFAGTSGWRGGSPHGAWLYFSAMTSLAPFAPI